MFLEDLYVKPAYRMRGIGLQLFTNAAQHAVEVGCKRMDFHVLKWNPARQFYEAIGAVDMSDLEGWLFYRMNAKALNALGARKGWFAVIWLNAVSSSQASRHFWDVTVPKTVKGVSIPQSQSKLLIKALKVKIDNFPVFIMFRINMAKLFYWNPDFMLASILA